MNKKYYNFGNPFKLKFREHYCYKCDANLLIHMHHKIVSQKSDEAKYYDFSIPCDGGNMVGSCEFIHKVFYCPKCLQDIEFVTQINQEDIDIILKKVKIFFNKHGRKINIMKCFENIEDEIVEICDVEFSKNLCILIDENNKDTLVYKISISRKECWERPYYFKINKKSLIKFIQKESNNKQ